MDASGDWRWRAELGGHQRREVVRPLGQPVVPRAQHRGPFERLGAAPRREGGDSARRWRPSTSCAVPAGTEPMTCSVVGSTTSITSPAAMPSPYEPPPAARWHCSVGSVEDRGRGCGVRLSSKKPSMPATSRTPSHSRAGRLALRGRRDDRAEERDALDGDDRRADLHRRPGPCRRGARHGAPRRSSRRVGGVGERLRQPDLAQRLDVGRAVVRRASRGGTRVPSAVYSGSTTSSPCCCCGRDARPGPGPTPAPSSRRYCSRQVACPR